MAEVKKPVSRKHRISQQFRNEYTVAYPVIRKSSVDCYHAFCTVCSADINISHGVLWTLRNMLTAPSMRQRRSKMKGKNYLTFPSSSDLSVISAEVLFTEFISNHDLWSIIISLKRLYLRANNSLSDDYNLVKKTIKSNKAWFFRLIYVLTEHSVEWSINRMV